MKRKTKKTREERKEFASSYISDLLTKEAKKLGYKCKDGGVETDMSTHTERWVLFEVDNEYENGKSYPKKMAVGLFADIRHNAIDTDEKWRIESGEIYSYNYEGDRLKTIKRWKQKKD